MLLISRERDWLKGGNDNKVKWRYDMKVAKYGISECDYDGHY